MNPGKNITAQRKAKGLTQQELATLTKVDLRTIQRIESGKSNPRAYTIKAIENALCFKFESKTDQGKQDSSHFLRLFCLSCFSYLVIPYIHFLIPNYLLNRCGEQSPEVRSFAKKVIQEQIYWVIATILVFVVLLMINFSIRYYFNSTHYISYLVPFFGMYALNVILIGNRLHKARRLAV
jgi:transcriptional regulator with XRE-family HTH domain